MSALVLGSYVAVEPLQQGEHGRFGIVLTPGTGRTAPTTLARVLAVGPSVGMVVAKGDLVLVERQSGHPGQHGEIDAGHFGGTPGRYAVLVPCEPGPKAASGDEEHDRRRARVAELRARFKGQPNVPAEVREEVALHTSRMEAIDRRRAGRARTRRVKQTWDKARGRGILAVIEMEAGDTPESVAASIA